MNHALVLATALLLASPAPADDGKPPSRRSTTVVSPASLSSVVSPTSLSSAPYTGLSFTAGAAATWADKATAGFYSGRPENPNNINLVLHSDTYGNQIWSNLVQQGLLSPSAVGSHNQLTVSEYPTMYYRTSLCYGVGIRYDYRSGFGWLLRFDISRLHAIGAFNLSTSNGTALPGTRQYIRCGMLGQEDRVNIELALTRTIPLGEALCLEVDLGGTLTNTKVKENLMEIGGQQYSILDRWGGHSPDYTTQGYEYINQGGVGYGVFATLAIGWRVQAIGAIKAAYSCAQSHTVLEGYTSWGWLHTLGIIVEVNNFSFL